MSPTFSRVSTTPLPPFSTTTSTRFTDHRGQVAHAGALPLHFQNISTPLDSDIRSVCHRIRPDFRRHPDSNHIIGFASDLFPRLLLSEANLQDTVWPGERDFLNHSVTRMATLFSTGVATPCSTTVHQPERLVLTRNPNLSPLHQRLPGDRFPHTAVLSCPCHYDHLLHKTFIPSPTTSTPVFQPLRHGIHLIRTRLRDIWPPHLLQRYRWGLHWDRRLPSAYILPKHSRDWSKARPIVSYAQTVCAPLSQTVASAIYCLLQVVFPELTALSDVLPLLRHIWRILQHYDPTDDLVLFQQDIAGFFNFVTHPRMISTVEFLIAR